MSVTSFVAVLRGKGDGTFRAAYEYASGTGQGPVIATDLDGDGKADVAVAGPGPLSCCYGGPGNLSILISSSNAVLGPPASYLGPTTPAALAMGDFDADGNADFVVAGTDGLAVYRGLSPGKLLAPVVISAPVSPLWADIAEDGRQELLTSVGRSVTASMWDNGRFVTSVIATLNDTIALVAVGDFNGDGHADLVVVHTTVSPNVLSFLPGRGDGTFGPPVDGSFGPAGLNDVVGDFNGDGNLDIVSWSPYDQSVSVFYGAGDGTFQTPVQLSFPIPAGSVTSARVDGGAVSDLVVTTYPGYNPGSVFVYLGSASGFSAPLITPITGYNGNGLLGVDVFDLNGDSAPDLIVTGGPNLAIYAGNGDGTFASPIYIGLAASAQRAVAGDFDHDGVPDIASVGNGHLNLLRGLGGFSFDSPTDQYVGIIMQNLVAVDFTGGGVPDLIVTPSVPSSSVIAFPSATLAATAPSNRTVCLGSPVLLKTSASGYGPVTYQWRRGGIPLSDGSGISGTATPTLSIAAAGAGDQGFYDVFVTDLCTTALSGVGVLTVAPPVSAPSIGPASVPAGTATVTISIASPAPAGGAQLLVNGSVPATIVAGATSTTVDLPTGTPGSTFVVTAVVTIGGCPSSQAMRTISVDFLDVPAGNPLREFVNTVARNGVTAGCGNGDYCPGNDVTRSQMAVFLLRSKDGPSYVPPACAVPTFGDVPCASPFAPWVDELAVRGVTAGCGGGNYCPFDSVTRTQMAVSF